MAQANEIELGLWVDGPGRRARDVDPGRSRACSRNERQQPCHDERRSRRTNVLDPPIRDRLNELQLPTLIIVGDLDQPHVLASAEHFVQNIPGAKMTIMSGTAHLPSMEQPAKFNRLVLDFLRIPHSDEPRSPSYCRPLEFPAGSDDGRTDLAAGAGELYLPLLPHQRGTQHAGGVRASDAPLIFGVLMPLLLLLVLAELGSHRANAKLIAALGILTAINAVLRIPVGIGDSPSFFFLPILLGYAYGARFGFLLGSLSMFVSALLTFGIGPWLPFQMFALGWLGMGAAGLRPLGQRLGRMGRDPAAGRYGYVGGMAFGALMNIYSWPFSLGMGGMGWQPGHLPAPRPCNATGCFMSPPP